MGKTYRKEKPLSKQRGENHPGSHGEKSINHDHDRTQRKRELHDIQQRWDHLDDDEDGC